MVMDEVAPDTSAPAANGATNAEKKYRELFAAMRERVLGPKQVQTVRAVLHGILPLMMDYPHELKGPYEVHGVQPRGWDRIRPDLPDEEQQMLLKCYWGENDALGFPALNIMEALREAAKEYSDPVYPKRTLKHMVEMAVLFPKEHFPLLRGEGKPIEIWSRIEAHTPTNRSGSRIQVKHPVVDPPWQMPIEMSISLSKTYGSLDPIRTVLVEAGRNFGIGAWRRRPYGRFEVEWLPQT